MVIGDEPLLFTLAQSNTHEFEKLVVTLPLILVELPIFVPRPSRTAESTPVNDNAIAAVPDIASPPVRLTVLLPEAGLAKYQISLDAKFRLEIVALARATPLYDTAVIADVLLLAYAMHTNNARFEPDVVWEKVKGDITMFPESVFESNAMVMLLSSY